MGSTVAVLHLWEGNAVQGSVENLMMDPANTSLGPGNPYPL